MFDKNQDIGILNSLIETTLDSVDGYKRAAEEASSSRFSSEFLSRANEREQVVRQLQNEVRRLGGNPEDDGSVLAAAHRAFLTIRDRATGGDDEAVIAEVDHGETYLRGKWETALKSENLSAETRSVITSAWNSVREGQEKWRAVHGSVANN
jgi:uncharacterized protein (TIGR02284 family)